MDGDAWGSAGPCCARTGGWAVDFQGLKVGVGGSSGRVGLGAVSRLRPLGRTTLLWPCPSPRGDGRFLVGPQAGQFHLPCRN